MGEKYEILDSGLLEDKEDVLGIVRWWERHRLLYNLFVLLALGLTSSIFIKGILFFGVGNFILVSIAFMLVANMGFCAGWSVEILQLFYLKKQMPFGIRRILLVVGIIFSILLTFSIYKDSFLYFQRLAG